MSQTLMQNSNALSHQSPTAPAITVPLGTPLSVAARELILSTLEHCGGERKRTAEMLGICTKTLYNRLREYGIREEHARAPTHSTMGDQSQAA
jgi:DNA-binding NtrC family response regulator